MSDQNEANSSISTPVDITDADFDSSVLNSDVPVLVDFWAEWCGPCKMIAPMLEEIAADYAGKVKIAKINIDSNPQTPGKYAVRSIPTLILFKNGQVESQSVGVVSKTKLSSLLENAL